VYRPVIFRILWAGPAGDGLAFLLALPLVLAQFRKFKKMEVIHENIRWATAAY
jgi:hypothetical protein